MGGSAGCGLRGQHGLEARDFGRGATQAAAAWTAAWAYRLQIGACGGLRAPTRRRGWPWAWRWAAGCYVTLADEEVREDGAGRRALAVRELGPGC